MIVGSLWVLISFVFVGYRCYVFGLVRVRCLGLGCLFAVAWLWVVLWCVASSMCFVAVALGV